MRILEITEEGEFMRIITDHALRHEFVYKKDKFKDQNQLEKEIAKSIEHDMRRQNQSNVKFYKIKKHYNQGQGNK